MVNVSDFLSADKTNIRWGSLIGVVFGGVFLAFWERLANLVLLASGWMQTFFQTFANGQTRIIRRTLAPFGPELEQAWQQPIAFVTTSGPLGFAIGVAFAIVTVAIAGYLIRRGVPFLG